MCLLQLSVHLSCVQASHWLSPSLVEWLLVHFYLLITSHQSTSSVSNSFWIYFAELLPYDIVTGLKRRGPWSHYGQSCHPRVYLEASLVLTRLPEEKWSERYHASEQSRGGWGREGTETLGDSISLHWQGSWCSLVPWLSYLKSSFSSSILQSSPFWALILSGPGVLGLQILSLSP